MYFRGKMKNGIYLLKGGIDAPCVAINEKGDE